MYEVNLNVEPQQLLDWDKPLSEQSDLVQSKIRNLQARSMLPKGWTPGDMAAPEGGGLLMQELRNRAGSSPNVSDLLRSPVPGTNAGIPGIQYLDQGSRAAGEGSRNYVDVRSDSHPNPPQIYGAWDGWWRSYRSVLRSTSAAIGDFLMGESL